MNEKFLLIYQVLEKLRFLNMQFNNTSRLNRANFLSISGKREIESVFCKTAIVYSIQETGVIKMKGMISLLTEIMLISFISTSIKCFIGGILFLNSFDLYFFQKFANWNNFPTYFAL